MFTKKFDTKTSNENDYGLGVIWDIDNKAIEEITICYDRERKESHIASKEEHTCLDMSIYSNSIYKYKRYLQKNKRNINPTLLKGDAFDSIKLFVLQRIIRGYVRSFYLFLKTKNRISQKRTQLT